MASFLKWTIAFLVLATAAVLLLPHAQRLVTSRWAPAFRTARITQGEIIEVVNATGDVQPVQSVRVGSFVSGPIKKLYVDYNDHVRKGDLLAEIDPRLFTAVKARDEAILATAKARLKQVQALLTQATNDYERAQALREEDPEFISDTENDRYKFEALAREAEVEVAQASVDEALANLENSNTNLEYTRIVSPVDGIVIDRRIEEGQTVTAQFMTPELFVVAPNMEKEMHVYASVDEADIGLIRDAQRREQPVYFTVDAYPDDLFKGQIVEIRMNPTSIQNVVTYSVVVSAPNPEMKLLPGMTADLSFHVEKRAETLRVPNAALRFYPKPDLVRPEDQGLLEGTRSGEQDDSPATTLDTRSAEQRTRDRRTRNRRHVWVVDGVRLRAVELVTGLSDYEYTEAVSGDLRVGQEVVVGTK